jgi:hypothetical protein
MKKAQTRKRKQNIRHIKIMVVTHHYTSMQVAKKNFFKPTIPNAGKDSEQLELMHC